MRSLEGVTNFTVGAVGPPGRRTFYLQVGTDERTFWFIAEKEQVAALAARLFELLLEKGIPAEAAGPPLNDPADPIFRIAHIAVGYGDDRIDFVLGPGNEDEGEPVAFHVEPGLAAGMAVRAVQVVAAGRPSCPFCGLPRDPEGHTCPAANGDLRNA